jgi:uncharacterized protein (TIGR03663 family)
MLNRFDLDRPIFGRLRLEHLLHLSLLVLAAVLRLLWLGYRPLHHDESIHAYYSWRIFTVGPWDYHYDPVYHGPALYYLTAAFEWLFGQTEASTRLLPVACGLGLVALAWPLRTLIGRREALFYAALVTLSPTLGYYSRSLRHDVPIAFFTFAALIAFLYFIRSGLRRYAYLAGIAIGFAAATKEDIYLSAFIFANALWLVGVGRIRGDRSTLRARAIAWARQVLAWVGRSWIPLTTGMVIALTIALVFYTSLLTRPEEWNAPARAIRYWWGMHEKPRIAGPWWYYLQFEIGYEPLIFLPALATIVSWLWRGAPSRTDLLFLAWTVLSFALYAWAQEKVPWLLVPVLLPQTVLAAHFFARQKLARLLWWSPIAAFTAWSLLASNYLYDALRTTEPAAETHFEPLVYVQTTYDITKVMDKVEEVGRTLGTGKATPMVVVGDATWPLSWYLRNYPVWWNSLPKETSAPIVIVDPGDAAQLEKDFGARYTATRFAVRGWWVIDWEKMTPETLLRFLITRRVWSPTGTTDAVMFVANDLAPHKVLPPTKLRPVQQARDYTASATQAKGQVIGAPGVAPGQFASPRGLSFDRDGNLLVADTQNNRIQKLTPDGRVLAVWGGPGPGNGPGQFRQPCGVAAGSDGSIYVADTWNHRIVKLDAEGHFILDWREENPGFWGPRAVVVAPNGVIFVADTGNKRVLGYDPGGQKLVTIGGEGSEPGKFVEPVGLAVDPQQKVLYVADTGNRRVQWFDLDGKFRGEWNVVGWKEFYSEPYLAVHAGALWMTDSFNHRVNAYDMLGTLEKSIDGVIGSATLGRPTGIAVASDGRVFVSDLTAGDLVVFDAAARAAPRVEMSAPSFTIRSEVRRIR